MSIWEPSQHLKSSKNLPTLLETLWRWLLLGLKTNADEDELADVDDVKTSIHVFLGMLILFCVGFLFWASFGRLDVASIAQGEIVPSTQLKEVQHLEGGIVKEIRVEEGDKVTKGQPLVILESTASSSDVQQLAVNIASLRVNAARLEAEIQGMSEPEFPQDLIEEYPNLVKESANLFRIRFQGHQSELTSSKEQIEQAQHEYEETQARLKNLKKELKLVQEQIKISEGLLKEDLTNRYNHIELLRTAQSLESRIQEDSAALKRISSGVEEKKSNLAKIEHRFQEEVSQKLEDTRLQLDELTKKMQKYQDSLRRTVLESPVNGIIKQLYVYTKGGVVKPGETILDIIPSGDQLIVDAHLPVQDIGYVQVGQPAVVRLASSDARRFDSLKGKVIFVSPDTLTDEKSGEPYYKVRIATDKSYFERGNLHYKLYPGMQVRVSIITGHRSVISYLLGPFFGWFGGALQER